MKWYAVPPYKNEGWKIFNEKGELVATFENKDECLLVVNTMNQETHSEAPLYPWDEAPEDAEYAVTDIDGRIEWWREKPTPNGNSWGTNREIEDFYICYGGRHIVSDWKNLLEKRPK